MEIVDPFYQKDLPLQPPFLSDSGSASASPSASEEDKESLATCSPEMPSSCDDSIIGSVNLEEPFEFDPHCGYTSNPEEATGSGEKLYPSSNVTLIQALAMLFAWFSSFPGLSKEAFNRLFYLLHTFLLPPGNNLPSSYYKAHNIITKRIVPIQQFDCCVNDCVLFRDSASGKYSSMTVCPKCGEGRYEPYSKTARKRFKYVPIQSRLRRMFENGKMSVSSKPHGCE